MRWNRVGFHTNPCITEQPFRVGLDQFHNLMFHVIWAAIHIIPCQNEQGLRKLPSLAMLNGDVRGAKSSLTELGLAQWFSPLTGGLSRALWLRFLVICHWSHL